MDASSSIPHLQNLDKLPLVVGLDLNQELLRLNLHLLTPELLRFCEGASQLPAKYTPPKVRESINIVIVREATQAKDETLQLLGEWILLLVVLAHDSPGKSLC